MTAIFRFRANSFVDGRQDAGDAFCPAFNYLELSLKVIVGRHAF
jgi:hypothetical protein